jgi:hypothetical protein
MPARDEILKLEREFWTTMARGVRRPAHPYGGNGRKHGHVSVQPG